MYSELATGSGPRDSPLSDSVKDAAKTAACTPRNGMYLSQHK